MIDEDLRSFFASGFINLPFLRRTAGLFFRTGECFRTDSIKYKIKRLLFSLAANSKLYNIVTIMPHSIDQRFSQVSNGWIYDPQFWDIPYLPETKYIDELAEILINKAKGRQICVALGAQNTDKGFEFFARIWLSNPAIREKFLFVAAGRVAEGLRSIASEIAETGGVILDRYISDNELATLYVAADCIWSCYSPAYNQSSGILGRAFQLGKPSIVRDGSYMNLLADEIGHPNLPLPYDHSPDAATLLSSWKPPQIDQDALGKKIEDIRRRDVRTILAMLGIDPALYKSPLDTRPNLT
ncbi:hypothetical protein [Rhizobium sp. FKL33]|uniref:hypothetical protein n=1 Tax=Rhizobium sp. FKL33 TaxID=2562307 RepID=UPI0010C11331|nr:hypothetical protein [Rhizobium sp. FKL33]